ncbi:MAG: DUF2975 domain-containing protein [Ruminococcus sp.]|nr:DUF2975 domain-containing protein [Ruminococcus sp.]
MKNINIKKINDLGTIGKIVSVIIKVIAIIALVISIILGVTAALAPDDYISTKGKIEFNTVTDCSSPFISRSNEEDDGVSFKLKAFGIEVEPERIFRESEILGLKIKTESQDTQDSSNPDIVTTESLTTIEGNTGKIVKAFMIGVSVLIFIFSLLLIISISFAKKLFVSLEKCDTPFSEEVVNNLSRFVYSLVPWGIFGFSANGLSGGVGLVMVIVVVAILTSVFKYGAELQRESDETL